MTTESRKTVRKRIKLSLSDMQAAAAEKGGICLSTEYLNSKLKLSWQCAEGHQWEAIYDSIRSGRWCPICGKQKGILSRTYTIDNAKELAKTRGGHCLSTEYFGSSLKLDWECSEGHRWLANFNSVQTGSWCPDCGKKKAGLARRNSIEDASILAEGRGGRCLSKIYVGTLEKLWWECAEGHHWESSYTNIQSGTWCPICDRDKKKLPRTNTIDHARQLARDHNGSCLSDKYERSNAKLRWECSEGHQWNATFESVKRGSWCLTCSGYESLTIEDMRELARSHNGFCLSNEYKNSTTNLKWTCSKGHVWDARPSHVKSGSWCPYCAGRHLSITDMKELAKERGGKCISGAYESAQAKLQWSCKNGHVWEASYAGIQSGSWCPDCSSYVGEKLCRLAFESLFGTKFPKSHPEWLRTARNTRLELDGFSDSLKIAFEHHGIQHYQFNSWFHKTDDIFHEQIERDKKKRELCLENGVALIEVPQIPETLSLDMLIPHILDELRKRNVDTSSLNVVPPNFNGIYLRDEYVEIYENLVGIAKERKGRVLSERYLGSKIKLEFECERRHRWHAIPYEISNGAWCRVCAGKTRSEGRKLGLEEMDVLASERGGKCLSEVYDNSASKLKWQCAMGHVWEAKVMHVKNGSWCPICSKQRGGLSRRLTIEDAKALALKRGGKCLSDIYTVFPNKLLWQCSEGHEWWSTYTNIQSGRWCPECRKRN